MPVACSWDEALALTGLVGRFDTGAPAARPMERAPARPAPRPAPRPVRGGALAVVRSQADPDGWEEF